MTRGDITLRAMALGAKCEHCFNPFTGADIRFSVSKQGTKCPVDSGEQYVYFQCIHCWSTTSLARAINKTNQLLLPGPPSAFKDKRHTALFVKLGLIAQLSPDRSGWELQVEKT